MNNWNTIRERYLCDILFIRLGGLAANLSRIKSFSDHPDHDEGIKRLIEESKFFIEWTASETEVKVAAEMVELQIQLALWQQDWEDIWSDKKQRTKIAEQADYWSKCLLDMSGLLR